VYLKFSLALPREALSIPVIRRVLGDALRGLGVDEDCVADMLVALSEACTNVIQHARTPRDFEVLASIEDDRCLLMVSDRGCGMADERPGAAGLLSESGRGIQIMRELVDEVSFTTRPDRGTAVSLHKRLTWREPALFGLCDRELVSGGR
jgi:serine/threonine-protein kinase RsbW